MSDTPRVSDPTRIRALTHPLRLELLDVLRDGPATATECAEQTGESVASCSFHLRMLAKYDFIELAERRGREKPWRLASPGLDIRPGEDDPESLQATAGAALLYVEHAAESLRASIWAFGGESREWVDATAVTQHQFWATAAELLEVSETLASLTDRFDARNVDPSLRPEGARPVRVFAAAHVDVNKEKRMKPSGA
ncbi:MAG: winged helix-turn-helix domain-containing protein [Acidimicrobiia bacterium]